jgi:hypothetical protein
MKILKDLGENYEYVRIIANNRLELTKLNLIEDAGHVISYTVIVVLVSWIVSMITLASSVALVIWLSSVFESLLVAILAFAGLLTLLLAVLFIFRNTLIIKPILNLYYSLIKDRI